jgi:lysyl-tRNA synthetase class II
MKRALVLIAALTAPAAWAQAVNDYPTNARAEYVFTCMATNGENREMLDRCSCAIDQIATVLPYDEYVSAETVLRMRQVTGERASMFKGMAEMTEIVARLRRAEAEAEILCF